MLSSHQQYALVELAIVHLSAIEVAKAHGVNPRLRPLAEAIEAATGVPARVALNPEHGAKFQGR